MLEVVVVLVLMGILVGLASTNLMGSRNSATNAKLIAAGVAYGEAINAFRLDHASRAPNYPDATDWPDRDKGPVDVHGTRYMKHVPEAVSDGDVIFVTSLGSPGPAGRLLYQHTNDDESWTLVVQRREGNNAITVCWLGTDAPSSGGKKC